MRCPVPYALLALLGWGAADAAIGRLGGWLGLRRWATLVRQWATLFRRHRPAPVEATLHYEDRPAYNKAHEARAAPRL